MRISENYKQLNRQLHADRADYGTSSSKWAETVANLVRHFDCKSVLDYGCGKGLLKTQLKYLYDHNAVQLPEVQEYDPAVPGKDTEPEPADFVVCTDVLEHIEPECLDAVLEHLAGLTLRYGFFSPSLVPATKTLADGRNTHLIVQPFGWWFTKLYKLFNIIEAADRGNEAVFVVRRQKDTFNA